MRYCLLAVMLAASISTPARAQDKKPDADELRAEILAKLILQNQRLQDWEDVIAKTQERVIKSAAPDAPVTRLICQRLLDYVREENLFNQLDVLQDRFANKVIDLSRRKDVDSASTANAALSKHYLELKKHLQQGPRLASRIEAERWEDLMLDMQRVYRFQAKALEVDGAEAKRNAQEKAREMTEDLLDAAQRLVSPPKRDTPAKKDGPAKKPAPVKKGAKLDAPNGFVFRIERIIDEQKFIEKLLADKKTDVKELRTDIIGVLKLFESAYDALHEHVLGLQGIEKLAAMDEWQEQLERAAQRLRELEMKATALAKARKLDTPWSDAQIKQLFSLAGQIKQVERNLNKGPLTKASRDVSGPLVENHHSMARLLRQLEERYARGDLGPDTMQMHTRAVQSCTAAAKLAVQVRALLAIHHQPPTAQPLSNDLARLGKDLDAIVAEQQAIQKQLDGQAKRLGK